MYYRFLFFWMAFSCTLGCRKCILLSCWDSSISSCSPFLPVRWSPLSWWPSAWTSSWRSQSCTAWDSGLVFRLAFCPCSPPLLFLVGQFHLVPDGVHHPVGQQPEEEVGVAPVVLLVVYGPQVEVRLQLPVRIMVIFTLSKKLNNANLWICFAILQLLTC